jgi:hypothetical protein
MNETTTVRVWGSFAWLGQYSPARMEAAAERTLVTGACRYQTVKSILKFCRPFQRRYAPMVLGIILDLAFDFAEIPRLGTFVQ